MNTYIPILTTRFTCETWIENSYYREKMKMSNMIYGSPSPIPNKFDIYNYIFIIAMNNTINQIQHISIIKNTLCLDKYYKIYKDCNYNRYVYKSILHKTREDLIQYNEMLVLVLETAIFKGKSHIKRGQGFTSVPSAKIDCCISYGFNVLLLLKQCFLENFYHTIVNDKSSKEEDNIENELINIRQLL
jgi:hypothetical protein